MSEIESWNLKTEREPIIDSIVDDALLAIESQYKPENGWHYHNVEHTKRVINDLGVISASLLPHERELLKIAGAFHDIVQIAPDPELESAEYCGRVLEETGKFSQDEIMQIANIIQATKAVPDATKVLDWPNRGSLSDFLRDCDMSLIGKPFDEFLIQTTNLYREFQYTGRVQPDDFAQFLERQIQLLEEFAFFRPETEQTFPYRLNNIKQIKLLLSK